jgi:hypothetical protein
LTGTISGLDSYEQFTDADRKWVASFLEDVDCVCEGKWTQRFDENTKQKLGIRAKGRKLIEAVEAYQVGEPQVSYLSNFGLENDDTGAENTYFWDRYW